MSEEKSIDPSKFPPEATREPSHRETWPLRNQEITVRNSKDVVLKNWKKQCKTQKK